MSRNFDRWTLLKFLEVLCTIACLAFKRVTDDEASRLFLYLQKLSREWSLLNNVTWDRIGAAVADTTYGGYLIITAALFMGRLAGELPTEKRIIEFILLGVGALLFIILGSLEFASLDSVPSDLVDNAAIIGTLSLVTAALFLLDMGGPKARKRSTQSQTVPRIVPKMLETRDLPQKVYEIEKEIQDSEIKTIETANKLNGFIGTPLPQKDDHTKNFGIYGKDVYGESDGSEDEEVLPPRMEEHSPVWTKIRKGEYGKGEIITNGSFYTHQNGDNRRPPSTPGDPGYVQYTAQHWGDMVSQKTPRTSPTQV